MSGQPSVAIDVIDTALRLSRAHPGAWLPCPRCAASLKAVNLESHLTKVHDGVHVSGGAPAALVLRGRDVAIVRFLVVAFVATFVGLVVAVTLTSGASSAADAVALAFGGVLLAVFAALIAAALGALTSTVEIRRDRLVLRYGLGRLPREVPLPARIEIGRLEERRPQAGMHAHDWAHEAVDAGAYLRLIAGGTSLTVTTPKGTAFRKHWAESGWRSAGTTRRTDITLRREQMVALEYALAEAGLLHPSGQEP